MPEAYTSFLAIEAPAAAQYSAQVPPQEEKPPTNHGYATPPLQPTTGVPVFSDNSAVDVLEVQMAVFTLP